MTPNPSEVDALLRAALRGEKPAWPVAAGHGAIDAAIARASLHGIHALLHEHALDWPPAITAAIRGHALAQGMWELRHQQVLAEALAALSHAGIAPVIIKGTALAYGLYPNPVLRARGDTDLLIGPADRAAAHAILEGIGFEHQSSAAGEHTAYQANYTRRGADANTHTIDLHWKINNSELLSRLFTHEELLAEASPLPTLSPHAQGAGHVHALLIACMHRATHRHNPYYVDGEAHHDPDRLVWLLDIHLLAARLTQEGWRACAQLAKDKGLEGAWREGLECSRDVFGTQVPTIVANALGDARAAGKASRYLAATSLRQHWMDLGAVEGWSRRIDWIRERLLPPREYMHAKYGHSRFRWLPWLYLRRAVGGMARRWAPH